MNELKKFLTRMAEEELDNGSTRLGMKLKEEINKMDDNTDPEELGSTVFDLYFYHGVELLEKDK